jgi:4-aminobutyrate--pyruvate transaminase
MGAGGVIVPPATYWAKIQAVLKKYDVLLVADEVICGFGRVGTMFACETFGITPDILVLSKQLSSSYMPISALVINDKMFEPIADESNRLGVLGHGFTAAGHPVAAAVANENLKIIEEHDLVGNARRVGERMQKGLRALAGHPLVGEVRGVGLIAAVELVVDKQAKKALEPVGKLGALVSGILQQNGALCRNMGDAIAFCPPLIITEKQVDDLLAITKRSLDEAEKQLKA